uniref:Uncharacterized protein n=1 Tax=Arundo donax TaxID=35708 RepID=A0A0A9A1F0_ARUDO
MLWDCLYTWSKGIYDADASLFVELASLYIIVGR